LPLLLGNIEPAGVGVLELGPRRRFGIATKNNVGTTTGHVGGDGDGPFATRLGYDLGFALVLLGVENFVANAASFEQRRKALAPFDRDGTDENRPPMLVDLGNRGARDLLLCFDALGLEQDERLVLFQNLTS